MTIVVLLVREEDDGGLLPQRWEGKDDPGDEGDLVAEVVVVEGVGGRLRLIVEEGVGGHLWLVV